MRRLVLLVCLCIIVSKNSSSVLPFGKRGAKVRGLFLTTKYFRSFFSKYFFQAVEATGEALIRSRSLSKAKVRYWVQRLSEGDSHF